MHGVIDGDSEKNEDVVDGGEREDLAGMEIPLLKTTGGGDRDEVEEDRDRLSSSRDRNISLGNISSDRRSDGTRRPDRPILGSPKFMTLFVSTR